MRAINSFRSFFWNIDPGYFNLKLATKTILAIVISLWIVRDEPMLTNLLAGIGSGFAMQGVVAKTMRYRAFHVFAFDVFYFTVFILGLMVRESPIWSAVLLTVLGFMVNYIRRFGLEKSIAPFMVWILCFLATILPFKSAETAWPHVYGLLVGLGVSAGVILFVFPDNYRQLFLNNTNLFFKALSEGMNELRAQLLLDKPIRDYCDVSFVRIKQTLKKLADLNQTIIHSSAFVEEETQLSYSTADLFALINAYSLALDAFYDLWQKNLDIPRATRLTLCLMCKQCAKFFSFLHMNPDFLIHKTKAYRFIPNLGERLGKTPSVRPDLIIALLNFKLSFELLSQSATKLLRNEYES
ncbi:hypothetical protein [Legionella impletisoli]|uniref:Uncharacterized protein n=1 Tax=Legionella impletisoli TaxID=343510 RepID=A0A917NAJ3_9GAMM|nr:hypothetical protein [Legionella impletisoli]GGI82826.1 hypothetical protein GCM10007966_09250 [Legionella impletisoli]